MGLPITKGIIEAHGGTIWVESEGYDEVKYPGTTFHVLLPIRKESPDLRTVEIFKPLADAGMNPPIMDELIDKQKDRNRRRMDALLGPKGSQGAQPEPKTTGESQPSEKSAGDDR